MTKKYLYIALFLLSFFPISIYAQEGKQYSKNQDATIDGLNFYPNPVSNGKIYITSKSSLDKDVTIYDVLGKLVFQATLTSKELNISSLSSGVYIIKIKEADTTATRKLIVR